MYGKRFSLILLLFLGVLVFWLNEAVRMGVEIIQVDPKVPNLTAHTVKTILFDKMGIPLNQFTSETFRYYRSSQTAWATAAIFERNNADQSRIVVTSERAQLLREKNLLSMQGKVKLVREKEQARLTVNSSDVMMRLDDEFVYSASPSTFLMDQNQVDAGGFDLNNQTGILNLYKGVKVSYVKTS